jgi:hypothetical protein
MDPDSHHFKILSVCSKSLTVNGVHLHSLQSCSVIRYLPIADYYLKGQGQSFGLYPFHADVL